MVEGTLKWSVTPSVPICASFVEVRLKMESLWNQIARGSFSLIHHFTNVNFC